MNEYTKLFFDLSYLFIQENVNVHYQKKTAELVEQAVARSEGKLADSGALCVDTGRFTGRTPFDRFIVRDAQTENTVWWGSNNQPLTSEAFERLFEQMGRYFRDKDVFVRDAIVGADPGHSIDVRVVTETAYQSIFANNLFVRPASPDSKVRPEWSVLAAPGYTCAEPEQHGLHNPNFVVINFTWKVVLIAGTGYTGEIKKSMFSVMNYILPLEKRILAMHCAANTNDDGHTALFFGLSGTGKTTLSAAHDRSLIGDDEHGWDEKGIFNLEGGCYAKCIGLNEDDEPEIFRAVRFGALVENTNFIPGTRVPDYRDVSKTENTRAAYPIHHVADSVPTGMAPAPRDIFFLTADAFGVIPPVSLLTTTQAMYHFISGYTAKVGGTEVGVKEPRAVFSACFGEAFLPLHPSHYAELLRDRLAGRKINVWLINTGWIAGPFGVGRRIKLEYTRAIVRAALNGVLKESTFRTHPVFGLHYPASCPGVPDAVLDPVQLWPDENAYYGQANQLAKLFIANFRKFEDAVSDDVLAAAPTVLAGNPSV
ncbi:phosphoenolpyruvate carboxykinase (ATP) [Parapedobacter sp. ISTM3]|uniref:Phosphoenolpyruvate carboxykinase (ATP) n=1 Tax=Parapedobacter luteus TaxID=623280 RepID=A0A1T5APG0_9SPHI|nr:MULTISPECIES: phosphoenolpyruvate carboxykinase (ATP) [Parapedobacter]MBK1441931.1 phosphoenolpyruvate carboxykinase (ATP) [Parapedobacter sp. ISTM3]SKB36765.1 phosphoenolpyruvate carboxykinase (ATP) [Parapedobacter luteus]